MELKSCPSKLFLPLNHLFFSSLCTPYLRSITLTITFLHMPLISYLPTPSRRIFILASLLTLLSLVLLKGGNGPDPRYILHGQLNRPGSNFSSISLPLSSSPGRNSSSGSLHLNVIPRVATKLASVSHKTIANFLGEHISPLTYIFTKPQERAFIPSTFYDSDPHGAIEIFDKHGVIVCRIYKLCRRRDASLEVPIWMSAHSTLLRTKCGLSNLHFKPPWKLKNRFGLPPYYDWVAPNLPTHALLKFTRVPLSYFFSHRDAKVSKLDDISSKNRVLRNCKSPRRANDSVKSSRICGSRPEGRIVNPAFLVNSDNDTAQGDNEFREALTEEFLKVHGVEADVFDPSSSLLRKPRACFRSLITAPKFHFEAQVQEQLKHPMQDKNSVDAAKLVFSEDVRGVLKRDTTEHMKDDKKSKLKNSTSPHFSLSSGIDKSTAAKNASTSIASLTNQTKKEAVSPTDERANNRTGSPKITFKTSKRGKTESQPAQNLDRSPLPSLTSEELKKNSSGSSTVTVEKGAGKKELANVTSTSNFAFSKRGRTQKRGKRLRTNRPEKKEQIRGKKKGNLKSTPNIDVFNFEGGVELFTHRAVHGRLWNDSSKDPFQHIYGVCRIHRACRRHDMAIVLPQWMKKYENDLRVHCGLKAVSYIEDRKFQDAYEKTKTLIDSKTSTLSRQKSKSYGEVELDLMGTRVYRAQEQHFMTDFFHDGIHAFDALFNQKRGRHAIFKRQCLYKPGSKVGSGIVQSRECASLRTSVGKLKPSVIVNERVRRREPASKYINEILAMMPPRGANGPEVLFSPHLSFTGPQSSTCFRSIVVTRNSYPPQPVLNHKEENVFFSHNNISRKSVRETHNTDSKDSSCRVLVTILKPRKEHLYTGTTREDIRMPWLEIQNQNEVIGHLTRFLRRVDGNITLDMRTFRHDGQTVRNAVQEIQDAEVIIGVNNPTMTSIAFARPHTSVIEIQPFGYSSGPYRSFARSLNLKYNSLMALPDENSFRRCVNKYYKEDWETKLSEMEMEKARDGLLSLFHNATLEFDGISSDLQLAHRNNRDGTKRMEHVPMERVCARAQQIRVNATRIAEMIADNAAEICRHRVGNEGKRPLGTDI